MNATVLFSAIDNFDDSQLDATRKGEIFALVVFVCDITDHRSGWMQSHDYV